MVGLHSIPPWLNALLNENFFEPCLVHSDSSDPSEKKPEKNHFCFDCCSSVCSKCILRHSNHVRLQARRYMYNDVLKLTDAESILDCSGVQAYITNSAQVVFLRQRPKTRQFRGSGNGCFTCNRNLQEPFLYCCLSCKVEHKITTNEGLKLNVSDYRLLGFSELDEFHVVTPDSVIDSAGSIPTSSGSTSSNDLRTALISTATTEIVRKKRSNLNICVKPDLNRSFVCPEIQAADQNYLNRRKKGVPNRSPLC
ncbi:unnamed protein product [Amaranthus hypochondriacus]